MKNELIIRPNIQQQKDQQVPDFGGYKHWELQPAAERPLKPDAFYKSAQKQLYGSALERALFFAYGKGTLPPVHFPNAEHFQHIPFTRAHWQQYGNMEAEYAKIHFVLDMYPSRGFPVQFLDMCVSALQSDDALGNWETKEKERLHTANHIFNDISQRMYQQRSHEPHKYHNGFEGAYQSQPIFYESSDEIRRMQKQLWLKGLAQMNKELAQGSFQHVRSFLELYNRIKDPITPVISNLESQVNQFISLYQASKKYILQSERNSGSDSILITQLALEASFLALPHANNIFAALYDRHHELPYIYVGIEKLPRGELANPQRVREIAKDSIADAKKYKNAVITPITVSYFQQPGKPLPELCILDGNNRATALLLFQYLHSCGYDREKALKRAAIDAFVQKHHLAIAWERDIVLTLNTLTDKDWEDIMANKKYISVFAKSKIPALLVQESNFDTIAVAKSHGSHIVLLQPMHQAVYNQEELPMAIPSKEQSHGRALGNDVRIVVNKNE